MFQLIFSFFIQQKIITEQNRMLSNEAEGKIYGKAEWVEAECAECDSALSAG